MLPRLAASLEAAPELRPAIAASIAEDRRKQDALEARRAALTGRIDRLLAAVEDGVESKRATRRILELEGELKTVEREIASVPPPPASESGIRAELARALDRIRDRYGDPSLARLWRSALPLSIARIEIAPIDDKPRGSTVSVTLREGGWPAVWRSLAETGWALE